MLEQILEIKMALALRRAQVSPRQQPAEPPVGGAIPGVGEHIGRAVDKGEPRARNDAQSPDLRAVLSRIDMRAHDARERVAIGYPDPRQPQRRRARDEFLRMRGAAKERKIRRRRKLGEARREADHLPFSRLREKVARRAG